MAPILPPASSPSLSSQGLVSLRLLTSLLLSVPAPSAPDVLELLLSLHAHRPLRAAPYSPVEDFAQSQFSLPEVHLPAGLGRLAHPLTKQFQDLTAPKSPRDRFRSSLDPFASDDADDGSSEGTSSTALPAGGGHWLGRPLAVAAVVLCSEGGGPCLLEFTPLHASLRRKAACVGRMDEQVRGVLAKEGGGRLEEVLELIKEEVRGDVLCEIEDEEFGRRVFASTFEQGAES